MSLCAYFTVREWVHDCCPLTCSLKHNRAFVSRENNIGVFRANLDDGAMEFVHTISNVVDAKGNRLIPSKVCDWSNKRYLRLNWYAMQPEG